LEPRWPVALAILGVIALLGVLPGRIRLLPTWFSYVFGLIVLMPICAVGLLGPTPLRLRVERTVTLIFFAVAGACNLAILANLIGAMVYRSAGVGGLQLLASSTAVWITNVIVFSMLYWQIDRGGPGAEGRDADARSDWLFPQEGAPAGNVPAGWQPTFTDYLYLGYSTATAFSTTDAMPLTQRAKLLMMLESTISLMTIVVVASRAINILGA
jgi:hypothetical protein